MSWSGYIDSLLATLTPDGSKCVTQAAICGLDGSPWASSPSFNVNPNEAKKMIAGFRDPAPLQASGILACNVKYMYLRTDTNDNSMIGKKGTAGVSIALCKQCIIIGLYDESIQPGNCNNAVVKMANYLREAGY